MSQVTHRVLQELFALLVGAALMRKSVQSGWTLQSLFRGDSGFAPPRIRILSDFTAEIA